MEGSTTAATSSTARRTASGSAPTWCGWPARTAPSSGGAEGVLSSPMEGPMMNRVIRALAPALALAWPALLAAQHEGHPAAADSARRVGTVSFPSSGAPAARPAFLRGLALLHDFEYPRAAAAFREAQRLDPGFAMAYWGEAMTHNHGIWREQDSTAARA